MMKISMLLDENVVHKSFGKGVINSADGKYVDVEFFKGNKKSRFLYPSCFQGFLRLENDEKQAEAEKDLEQWKVENGIMQKEQLRLIHEKTAKAINARKATAKKSCRPHSWY